MKESEPSTITSPGVETDRGGLNSEAVSATDSDGIFKPRTYVACLASYNAGILHGTWIDIDEDTVGDDIREEIAKMLRASPEPNVMVDCPHVAERCRMCLASEPCIHGCGQCRGTGKVPSAEEWAIHDYEGFDGIQISEYEGLDAVALHGRMIERHGAAWAAYVNWQLYNCSEDDFDERYRGEWDSPAEYVDEFINDCYDLSDVPDFIRYHIDYDGIARDMRLNGDVYFSDDDGPCHVFEAH